LIRKLTLVSLALFAAFAVSAQTPVSQLATEQLTNQQLTNLVATAKTPADHDRLANYYELKAQVHAQMLVGFMANNATNNDKSHFGTVDHCDFMFKSLNQRARIAHKQALEQERLAQVAAGAE
jgi:hypothetical protein